MFMYSIGYDGIHEHAKSLEEPGESRTVTDHPTLNDSESIISFAIKPALLKARHLQKQLGLTFHPTDDLRYHLMLERKSPLH